MGFHDRWGGGEDEYQPTEEKREREKEEKEKGEQEKIEVRR